MTVFKTLSIRDLCGFFVVYGVKDVENRTWSTDYRGRLLIHASGSHQEWPWFEDLPQSLQDAWSANMGKSTLMLPEQLRRYATMLGDCESFLNIDSDTIPPEQWSKAHSSSIKKHGFPMQTQSIIGHVDLIDVARDSASPWAITNHYHWILDNPVAYAEPIMGVKGKLGLWEFDLTREPPAISM